MLYQKVRPKKFSGVVGNSAVVSALERVVKAKPEKRPHAFLFQGPSGCGKTTLARILATELGCTEMAIVELNAANTRGIDSVREVAQTAETSPMFGNAKAYILDESHQLTSGAQQALLKVIEDCPKHTYFMFCTTDPEKIIKTIRNRCAIHAVSSLRKKHIVELVLRTAKGELIECSEETAQEIARAADGCPRQALMYLEQIQDLDDPKEALAFIQDTVLADKDSRELIKEILGKRKNRWEICIDILKRIDADPEQIRRSMIGYVRKVLLDTPKDILKAARYAAIIQIFEKPTYTGGKATLARMVFEACLED